MSDVKQVIVIRKDLKMRRGKEVAQGAHASIAWLTNRLRWHDGCIPDEADAVFSPAERQWAEGNFRKICVQVQSELELLDVVQAAQAAGLEVQLIQDGGLTESGGVSTYTAAAIGPDEDEKIDPVTGTLVLY